MSNLSEACRIELDSWIQQYYIACGLTFGVTVFLWVAWRLCLRDLWEDVVPGIFYLAAGMCKVVFSIMLFSSFLPHCPKGCDCEGVRIPSPIYPFFCLILGAYWLKLGYFEHSGLNKPAQAPSEDPDAQAYLYSPMFELRG